MNHDESASELYRKYRPKTYEEVIGQDNVIAQLESWGKENMPHALLLTGASGVGKTTIARIVAKEIGCTGINLQEVNAAESRGIDTVRDFSKASRYGGLGGGAKVWILDEVHRLTPDSMSALLKVLEDCPPWAYFFLCTTDPGKLLPTIRTRCTTLSLKPIPNELIEDLVIEVATEEGVDVENTVAEAIVTSAEGGARKALVLLGSIIGLGSVEEQLAAIAPPATQKAAFDLCKALLWERSSWKEVAAILKGIEGEEPEQVRRLVLACARTELLKAGKSSGWAYLVITCFGNNFFDSAAAGLAAAAYEVMSTRGK